MYDRKLKEIPPRQSEGFRYRVETLVGVTGWRMAKYRDSWSEVWWAPFMIFWRPHLLAILVFEVRLLSFYDGTILINCCRQCCSGSALVLT